MLATTHHKDKIDYNKRIITWKAARSEGITKLRLFAALLAGGNSTILLNVSLLVFPNHEQKIDAFLLSHLGKYEQGFSIIIKAIDRPSIDGFLPNIAVFALGVILILKLDVRYTSKAYDILFNSFNYDVLRPVNNPYAFDPLWGCPAANETPAMPWLNPICGPRRDAWNQLNNFIDDDAGDGRTSLFWWRHRNCFRAFTWAVVTGQAGAGKSRMAAELARARARSALLDDITTDDSYQLRWQRRRLKIGAWLRRVCPTAARNIDDPWDAAYLLFDKNIIVRPMWDERNNIDDNWVNRISEWRPARPTILLLDDPLLGDASAVIKVLHAQSDNYYYPVRLIIVSQIIPFELNLNAKVNIDGKLDWSFGLAGFTGVVVALTSKESLLERDIRMLAATLQLPLTAWRGRDADVHRFFRVTRGNPLLAELGFAWLHEGKPLEKMTKSSLITDRAQRIVVALKNVDLGSDNHLHALAVATIVGGTGITQSAQRAGLLEAFGQPNFPRDALRRVFCLEATDVTHLPPVRPELIGDGFVRYIVGQAPDDPNLGRQIASQAWRIAPQATLRTSGRLLQGVDAEQDELAAALGEGPPADAGLDSIEVAATFTDAAVMIPRENWDACEVGNGAIALSSALKAIAALTPEQAASALERFSTVMQVDNAISIVRGGAGLTCFCAVALRGLDDPSAWTQAEGVNFVAKAITDVFTCTFRWGFTPVEPLYVVAPAALVQRLSISGKFYPQDPNWQWLSKACFNQGAIGTGRVVSEFLAGLSEACHRHTVKNADGIASIAALRQRLLAEAAAVRNEPDVAAAAAARLDIESKILVERNWSVELERVQAWQAAAWAFAFARDTASCVACLNHVEEVVDVEFSGIYDFELVRIQVHLAVGRTSYYALNTSGCHATAARVEAIVLSKFSGMPEFELQRSRAWATVANAYAKEGNEEECLDAVRRVEEIVDAGFSEARNFVLSRTQAWRGIANLYANKGEKSNCLAAAQKVEVVINTRYVGEIAFELERIRVRTAVAEMFANLSDIPGCLTAVEKVETALPSDFVGRGDFTFQRVLIQNILVLAYSNVGDIAKGLAAVRKVEAIIEGGFAHISDFEHQRTIAWRTLALASAKVNDVSNCLSAAKHVDSIIDKGFAGGRRFEVLRASAWRYVAVVAAAEGQFRTCLDAVARVEKTVIAFAGVAEFENEKKLAQKTLNKIRL